MLMLTAVLRTAAYAQVAPIGPFTGEISESFDDLAVTQGAVDCLDGRFGGVADACAVGAAIGGIQVREDAFLGTCLVEARSTPVFAGTNDGSLRLDFAPPVTRFGGWFATHAATAGSVDIAFLDAAGDPIGSVAGPLDPDCGWTWFGADSDGGALIASVTVAHSLNGGALVDLDDLQLDTACGLGAPDGDDDGTPACVDCDDADPTRFLGAPERCDGVDQDCDGAIDEDVEALPPASNQVGICEDADQVCVDGQLVDPGPDDIAGFEVQETLCDGVDNDCDGEVDAFDTPPPVGPGLGVCLDLVATCEGDGFIDPDQADWPMLVGFESVEATCDGLDNDCDGLTDEDLEAPLADNQLGVCSGSTLICNGSGFVQPTLANIPNGNAEDVCDEFDNDCDGVIDEDCAPDRTCGLIAPTTGGGLSVWLFTLALLTTRRRTTAR